MKFLRHRINNPEQLRQNDIVEIDVRVKEGIPMVSHDDKGVLELVWDLNGYLRKADKLDVQLVAVNIKTDGEEDKIIEILENSKVPYFVFDMSRPSYVRYAQLTDKIALPVSEYDHVSSLENFKPTGWVWLDCFNNLIAMQHIQFLKLPSHVEVVAVAPDLHGRRDLNPAFKELFKDDDVYILTDHREDFE